MTKLKFGKIDDEKPVKLTLELPASLRITSSLHRARKVCTKPLWEHNPATVTGNLALQRD